MELGGSELDEIVFVGDQTRRRYRGSKNHFNCTLETGNGIGGERRGAMAIEANAIPTT